MSAVAALPAPHRAGRQEAPARRHIEIAATRGQKKSRPRAVYALVTVAGLFAILIAQLLLSIVVSEGAYQISSLQQEQRELARDQQVISEELQVLESPQHLAANAETLGMVSNSSTAYLRLADGVVLGSPVAARSTDGIRTGTDGGPLIPNTLLDGVPMASVTAVPSEPGVTTQGAPGSLTTTGSVASTPQGLPSPITR